MPIRISKLLYNLSVYLTYKFSMYYDGFGYYLFFDNIYNIIINYYFLGERRRRRRVSVPGVVVVL